MNNKGSHALLRKIAVRMWHNINQKGNGLKINVGFEIRKYKNRFIYKWKADVKLVPLKKMIKWLFAYSTAELII